MTPIPLGLFVKKLQPNVGLAGYDMLFAYFVVEATGKPTKWIICFSPMLRKTVLTIGNNDFKKQPSDF